MYIKMLQGNKELYFFIPNLWTYHNLSSNNIIMYLYIQFKNLTPYISISPFYSICHNFLYLFKQ